MLLLLACTSNSPDSSIDSEAVDGEPIVEDSSPPKVAAELVVNEFMASNGGSLTLDDASTPDWIELHNAGEEATDLEGWFLSDDSEDPYQVRINESLVLEPGGFALFYADGVEGSMHLPFQLASEGEELVLSNPQGVRRDWIAYEPQLEDVAAARSPDGGEDWVFVPDGTPGQTNND